MSYDCIVVSMMMSDLGVDKGNHLKALYHAIRADCLLIGAARAHAVNEQWAWWRIDKFACTFKPAR